MNAGAGLAELAGALNRTLEGIGCPRDTRVFTPHLTLARLKRENIDDLRTRLASMRDASFGDFEATEFHLYLSRHDAARGGSVYSKLATFELEPRESEPGQAGC